MVKCSDLILHDLFKQILRRQLFFMVTLNVLVAFIWFSKMLTQFKMCSHLNKRSHVTFIE